MSSACAVDFATTPEQHEFAGASGQSQAGIIPHVCFQCKGTFANYSRMAYVSDEEGFPFAKSHDVLFSNTMDSVTGKPQIVNHFQPKHVFYNCLECCEEQHNKKYKGPDGKPTKVWLAGAKKSKGVYNRTARDFTLKQAKTCRPKMDVDPGEIFAAMQNGIFRRSTDWIVELAGFMWVMYGCYSCRVWPVKSSSWFRATRNVRKGDDTEGMTSEGTDFGHWRCCNCWDKWSWKEGSHRCVT